MAAGNTYIALATNTLSSTASSVTFSSISSSYTDLIVVCSSNNTVGATYGYFLQFNGDNGNNYSSTRLYGTGSAAASANTPNVNYIVAGWNSTAGYSILIAHIFNYANTTTYKTALTRTSDPTGRVNASAGLWRGSTGSATQAITSVTVLNESAASFTIGSTFTLYGILAA
jgi:hypothetical protein